MEMVRLSDYRPPVLPLELLDESRTTLMITPPPLKVIERLQEEVPVLFAKDPMGKQEKAIAAYELAAKLMSSNLDGMRITVEELRDKYRVTRTDLVNFYNSYLSFLTEIQTAKN